MVRFWSLGLGNAFKNSFPCWSRCQSIKLFHVSGSRKYTIHCILCLGPHSGRKNITFVVENLRCPVCKSNGRRLFNVSIGVYCCYDRFTSKFRDWRYGCYGKNGTGGSESWCTHIWCLSRYWLTAEMLLFCLWWHWYILLLWQCTFFHCHLYTYSFLWYMDNLAEWIFDGFLHVWKKVTFVHSICSYSLL